MIIECSYCKARVDANVVAQHDDPADEDIGLRYKVSLVVCPTCQNSLVAGQSENQCEFPGEDEWNSPLRIWPSPDKHFSLQIPSIVRSSMEEANKCFKAGAYSACAVMCGRALEAICKHHKTKGKFLAAGLGELHEREVIDGRLFKWSQALRVSRNLGAHATGAAIPMDTARDLLLFANAICEYVFVLSEQFDQFMCRQEKQKKET